MNKEAVATNKAPSAIGPYSQAIKANGMVFTSGQLPINPITDKIDEAGIEWQTHMCIKNIEAILKEAGSDLSKVVKTSVFLTDLSNFAKVNEIYASYFSAPYPGRSCYEVSKLPKEALIEIEVIAMI